MLQLINANAFHYHETSDLIPITPQKYIPAFMTHGYVKNIEKWVARILTYYYQWDPINEGFLHRWILGVIIETHKLHRGINEKNLQGYVTMAIINVMRIIVDVDKNSSVSTHSAHQICSTLSHKKTTRDYMYSYDELHMFEIHIFMAIDFNLFRVLNDYTTGAVVSLSLPASASTPEPTPASTPSPS